MRLFQCGPDSGCPSGAPGGSRPAWSGSSKDVPLWYRSAGSNPGPHPVTTRSPSIRRLQRRFSFVLAAALCLWMLAVASHFHIGDYADEAHQGAHSLCAFCASVPNTGAAPAVVAFAAAPSLQSFLPPAEIVPAPAAPAISRYYSRGPPLL